MSTNKIDIKDASLLETRQYIGGQWSLPTGQDTFQVLGAFRRSQGMGGALV